MSASGENQQAVEAMKSKLLIALVNRLGGSIAIPVEYQRRPGVTPF
jgi:hypothetical protein